MFQNYCVISSFALSAPLASDPHSPEVITSKLYSLNDAGTWKSVAVQIINMSFNSI